ncbi:MAG: alkylation response protein AidB-like acyl-CoA dehydrogenase [Bradymonadia bacterium]|jgi:alkylation response protein AidB-like acyl-CoA dehydrogenase
MTAGTTGLATAYLEPEIAVMLWTADEPVSMAGVFAPMGKALPTEGGYTLNGRWPFGSGAGHSTWLMLGGLVLSGAAEKPELAAFFVHHEDVTTHDTWHVSGLRGTGSNDLSVCDVFVPAERVVSLTTGSPQSEGRLFRFPIFGLLACGVAAVGLGIARASIDEFFAQNCSGVRPSRAANDSLVQVAVAEAEGRVRAARAYLFAELERIWLLAEGPLEPIQAADIRLAALHAVQASVAAVDAIYYASGGSAIYEKNRQERHFRDIHVVQQHIMVSPRASKLVARVLMGIETDTSQL